MAEEIWMNFVANKDENQKDEQDDAMSKIKGSMGAGQGIVKCRICGGDHWTSQCPYKDTLAPLRESLQVNTLFSLVNTDHVTSYSSPIGQC